jgi:glycosyltransferase involved in cell wall biosynthesis
MNQTSEQLVSIVIPCFNEKGTIESLLVALREQSCPALDQEIIIADGMSTDGTREVITAFAEAHPEMKLSIVDNPKRIIPAALNRAIKEAKGSIVIRLDAHAAPEHEYIERCLETLERTGAANVGGLWIIKPGGEGWIARAIAVAASHRLGAGDARYRISGDEGPVETVPFGAFQQAWLERVGDFDETLLTNEDYEFNTRLREAGGIVWFNPAIRSIYYARSNLAALARQYARYGFWKTRMLRRYPGTLRWRQALPPSFVLSGIALAVIGFFVPLLWFLLAVQLGAYFLITMLAGIREAIRHRDISMMFGFPLALWTMHFSWGGSFLWGIIYSFIGADRE